MPIEYAIPKVHKFLSAEGIREKITLIASGGIRTAYDALKAIALGADGVVIGTAEMVALGCVRCACCESGRGCPRGIASTDPELVTLMSPEWATQRLINLQNAWHEQMVAVLRKLGMSSIRRSSRPQRCPLLPRGRAGSQKGYNTSEKYYRTIAGNPVADILRRRNRHFPPRPPKKEAAA